MDFKREQYFESGVRLVWYVYPDTRTVQVYTVSDESTRLAVDDSLNGGEVVPGFSLSIQKWFDKAK